MADIFLTNSLTRRKEKFVPINPPEVGIYTCGPTVYDYATIGNFRTYVTADILVRVLKANGYDVNYVMNITDVGHLTGDNLGDADIGEDRIEKSAKAQGKTAWEIAKFYTEAFLRDFEKLNLLKPAVLAKATEHIPEQIALVKKLEEKDFTYKTSDGIYFDTVAFEEKTGKKYGELSTLDTIKEGARVEPNPEKKNPRDFALWKFSKKPGERHMEWDSPWGVGFPGWHIECSAMSMKYLGESFDIHVGGEDLRQTHHPNEIAQSEAATDKPFVKYWIHAAFLQVDGKRMGKSLGNTYTVSDIEKKDFDALALRYLYLTANYRDSLNFTWDSLASAQNALKKLRAQLSSLKSEGRRTVLSREKNQKVEKYRDDFSSAVNDDLNTPKALATLWEMLKSNVPSFDKYDLALAFDEVLGLKLSEVIKVELHPVSLPSGATIYTPIPDLGTATIAKIDSRELARSQGDLEKADQIRAELEKRGYQIRDTNAGTAVYKKET